MNKMRLLFIAMVIIGFTNSGHAGEITWSGFGSLYGTMGSNKNHLADGLVDDRINFSADSLFGLNLAAAIDDKITASAQIVAASLSPNDSWTQEVKWGYLTYQFDENLSFKIGRQLLPVLIGSEYANVRFLLPYENIPVVARSATPFDGFEGISAQYTFGYSKVGVFWGLANLNFDLDDLTGSERDVTGITYDYQGENFGFHFMYMYNVIDVQSSVLPGGAVYSANSNYSMGYRYDNGTFVHWTEALIRRNIKQEAGVLLRRYDAYYTMFGYRISDFMPRVTVGQFSNDTLGTLGMETSYNVGLNYQLSPMSVIKIDYTQYVVDDGKNPARLNSVSNGETEGSTISAGVDFIF